MDTPSRADQLADVRKALKNRFPKAEFFTNDDANPATPMIVRAEWDNGRYIKAVRADSLTVTVPQFVAKAADVLTRFQANAIPSRHWFEA